MERKKVFRAIDTERDFQEIMKIKNSSHIVEDFPLSSAMSAIRYNLDKMNESWYGEQDPYEESMEYVRKIAAICVQMGEKYEMKERKY